MAQQQRLQEVANDLATDDHNAVIGLIDAIATGYTRKEQKTLKELMEDKRGAGWEFCPYYDEIILSLELMIEGVKMDSRKSSRTWEIYNTTYKAIQRKGEQLLKDKATIEQMLAMDKAEFFRTAATTPIAILDRLQKILRYTIDPTDEEVDLKNEIRHILSIRQKWGHEQYMVDVNFRRNFEWEMSEYLGQTVMYDSNKLDEMVYNGTILSYIKQIEKYHPKAIYDIKEKVEQLNPNENQQEAIHEIEQALRRIEDLEFMEAYPMD